VSDNHIGNDCAKAISKALETNMTLTRLYIVDNAIGNDSATPNAKALETNITLTALYLYGNGESDKQKFQKSYSKLIR
jgi:NLR family CARD domain-containing protein 3